MAIFLIAVGVIFLFASFSAVFLWRRKAILQLRDQYEERIAGRSRWLQLNMPYWHLRLYPRALDDSLTVLFTRVRLVGMFLMGAIALAAGIITAVN